jgi:glutamine phosphoribosylpyrophosphate amidotransferase
MWKTDEQPLQYFRTLHYGRAVEKIASLKGSSRLVLAAHTRYSTSGDWQTAENNQPVVVCGGGLIFNGVISMKTKPEYEREYCQKYETENDGEIFLRRVDKRAFLREMGGSFAGIWAGKSGWFVGRNERRPLWAAREKTTVFIASTRDMFARSNIDNPFELAANEVFPIGDIDKSCSTAVSQQASELFGVPPKYAAHRRYRPRVSSNVVSG